VRPVSARRGGFTLVEALVVLAIMSLLIAAGMPAMSNWLVSTKAAAAGSFYADGLALARTQAVSHDSASRLVLVANTKNGQYDWRVDICYPTAALPCSNSSGTWSTTTTIATPPTGTPADANGYKSVLRVADGLPDIGVMKVSLTPATATAAYFTPLGWVDATVDPRLERITLAPTAGAGRARTFPTSAVALTLAGLAIKCNPNAADHDSLGCPK
jgi:type IV fimbrial biogenesis protein FimT